MSSKKGFFNIKGKRLNLSVICVFAICIVALFTVGILKPPIHRWGSTPTESSYIVSTQLNMPDKNVTYLEVTTPDGSYTEYPVESDSSASNKDEAPSYMLSDWLTSDNKLYQLNQSYDGSAKSAMWFKYPDKYAETVSNRKNMYWDLIVKGLSNVKKEGVTSINLGLSSTSQVQMYSAKVSASTVSKLFKTDSYDLYSECLKEAKSKGDEKLVAYLTDNLDALDLNLTFSKGEIHFGVLDNNVVFYSLETGGLGSRLKLTRQFIFGDTQLRSLPDFSSSIPYYDNFKTYVDNLDTNSDTSKSSTSTDNSTDKPSDSSTDSSSNTSITNKPSDDTSEGIENSSVSTNKSEDK